MTPEIPGFPPAIAIWITPIAMVVLGGYLFMVRRAATPLIAAGRLTAEERDAFLRAVALYFFGSAAVGYVVGRLFPTPTLSCGILLNTGTIVQGVGTVIWIGIALHWLWRGRGAELAAKMGPTFSHGMNAEAWTPAGVRFWGTVFVVVLSVVGSVNAFICR